ncbi:hypothetical protein [Streptomyces roseochromogenus]|uniref:hypothetical protein n=1 Tax=Streptomyces roseochromogenus TaxID=285450 RepID=UPI000ABD6276|nr:hypothetical protein [Streptomyces roseochromogenus]
MNTSQPASKKALSRICAISAVLGIALATGTATAASAAAVTPAPHHHTTHAAAPAGGHDEDDGNNGCIALIALLC